MSKKSKMFSSLLKYWRGKRGLSQLDLALKADVSTRHISFLETGRSQPSRDMVIRLLETLDIPMREQNLLMIEAGFEALFPEPELAALQESHIRQVLEMMMDQHEPYPMTVLNRWYDIVSMNGGALTLIQACLPGWEPPPDATINAMKALFHEDLLKPLVLDWDMVAREMLARLHRELLHRPQDERLSQLLDELLSFPGVPKDWRAPDLSRGNMAVLPFRLRAGEEILEFVTTITIFSTPQNVTLEELQIESYFPLNETTKQAWSRLQSSSSGA